MIGSLFEAWVVEHGGTLRVGTLTVTLDKCVQTFPCMHASVANAEEMVCCWFEKVEQAMNESGGGFTAIFNRVHDPKDDGV
jgi:hypothetical protein